MNSMKKPAFYRFFGLCIVSIGLLGCSHKPALQDAPAPQSTKERRVARSGKLMADALVFGPRRREGRDTGTGNLGVNSHLWYAALDTLSFVALQSADPFGGLIVSEWYTPTSAPHERFKLTVMIVDRQLRSDAVQVKVLRQIFDDKTKSWVDSDADSLIGTELENIILTRARALRINNLNR